jgi:hypothetical protein
MKEAITTSATMSKKLSFTPSPDDGSKAKGGVVIGSHGKMKITPKSAGVRRRSPAARTKATASVGRSSAYRNNVGFTVPKVTIYFVTL